MNPSTVLAIQSWTLYAIAISLIFSRIIFRRITLGSFRMLQADDWLMISAVIPFTAAIALANQATNIQFSGKRKYRYVLEEMQIVTIWLVKACLLALYWRIFPVATNLWKRRILKGLSAFCCISFLVVQITLILSCPPSGAHWTRPTSKSQCMTYYNHTALTLAFNIPNTMFIMILPVPFIPTPRRLLLAILLTLGTLVFITGIVSRARILKNAPPKAYLHWYTAESALSIIFANLPFLTSLVVATAPARIRDFSHNLRASKHLALSQWPRSRRGSWNCVDGSQRGSWATQTEGMPPSRVHRLDSTATTISELPSPIDIEKAPEWSMSDDTRRSLTSSDRDVVVPPNASAPTAARTKMRLSGGLAEMGDVSTNNTEGWPAYWR